MNDPNSTGPYQPATADVPAAIDSAPAAPPQHIGRYRVDKVLGKGGFGLVYLAYDGQLQRLVAIKVPHRDRVSSVEDAEAHLTEARTVANLDHPHIVPVYDVGSTAACPCFIVSKFIEGSTLAQRLKNGRPTFGEAAELVATIAVALHYAHRNGLVHRDVKPGNILLDAGGKPFLVDFGLALKEANIGHGPRYAGTAAYMSPEQARGEGHRVDGRSDIFSLGVVFYELLVGRRPFRADSKEELTEQIASFEPKPPRQCDDGIPKELDRICLKALSKRVSERYSAATDMANDLRHFLAQQPSAAAKSIGSAAIAPAVQPPSTSGGSGTSIPASTPTSNDQAVKIVPKGLRSFDAHDADFFLELLPGPRDRDGLPDGIRFWKTRIEEADLDNTFSVGLIYGPSGCGKSSLVKAGLLPQLSSDVIVVYVEATADETETRLLSGLRKRCPALPDKAGLQETLAGLRRGQGIPAGKKVLIVLDQFEQWLHAKKEEHNTELVQALRQCDGARVQCIVMVRDDFWLAVSRFMRDLEVRLVEGHSSALVDLFDGDHARKVLSAFGRAFGRLQDNPSEVNREQEEFLTQAVSGLAQDGKVIPVRLALFAEMMKGKAWTPTSLKEAGGTEGVGSAFLEETFSASTAPPEHRYHQNAARGVLKVLLPESGTDIKGHMRSYAELLEVSGCKSRPRDFDGLMRILDSEIRLITPTDPEGKEEGGKMKDEEKSNSSSRLPPSSFRYYQLTHDYLVPSLRDWLTRKQKETRRGRAALLLADRAAVWNARPENRQLPPVWQWLQIKWLTAEKNWTPPQRKMMQKAGRHHAVGGAVVGMILVVLAVLGYAFNQHAAAQLNATRAAGMVHAILNAETAQVPGIIGQMAEHRALVDPLLREENDKAAAKSRQKLHASLALLPTDAAQVDYLYGRLLDGAPNEVPVIRDALAPHKDALLDKLWAVAQAPEEGKDPPRLRAAAALAKYDPEGERWGKASALVANGLVLENPVFLGSWSEAFLGVKNRLVPQLSEIFRDHSPERAAERHLATNLLLGFTVDQPKILADLLMDADEKQFAAFYPKVQEHGNRSVSRLLEEIEKQPVVVKDKMVLESTGMIAKGDEKVEVLRVGALLSKQFEVRLQGGKTYRLTMDSSELDCFLVLQDKAGKELAIDNDGGAYENALLVFTPAGDDTYAVFAASFDGKTGSFVLKIKETMAEAGGKEKLARRQTNAAVALLKMGRAEKVWPLLKHSPDPRARSYLIHRFASLGADAGAILNRLDDEPDVTIRRALVLSLGDFDEKAISPDTRKAVLPKLQEIYRTAPDPGLHASVEWLLRTWQQEAWLKQVNDGWAEDKAQREKRLDGIKQLLTKDKEKTPPQWYVNGQRQTMVVIPGPVEFVMGSPPTEVDRNDYEPQHKKQIGRTFAIAAKSVTVEQYRQFEKNITFPPKFSRTAEMPVVGITWYEAAKYCNFLSKEEGIPEGQWCYEVAGKVMNLKVNYLSLTGYRLPTETETEFATRAGAVTSRYYGETEELLPKYAWCQTNSQAQTWPVGILKPNDLGLFDVLGNVFTWCQDVYKPYAAAVDQEDGLVVISTVARTLRGGAFGSQASDMRSAYRDNYVPTGQDYNFGFRLAGTLPLGSFPPLPRAPETGRK